MAKGSAPVIADLFPGLWEYYALTARSGDQFFGATGGAGYTYPWSLPDPKAYFQRVESLNQQYMPADVWEDVWDGGCPQVQLAVSSLIPCWRTDSLWGWILIADSGCTDLSSWPESVPSDVCTPCNSSCASQKHLQAYSIPYSH